MKSWTIVLLFLFFRMLYMGYNEDILIKREMYKMTVLIICTSYLLLGAVVCWVKHKMIENLMSEMFKEHPDLLEVEGILVALIALILIIFAPVGILMDVICYIPLKIRNIMYKRETKRLRKRFEAIRNRRIKSESKRAE